MVINNAGNIYPKEVPVGISVSLNPVNAGISRLAFPVIPAPITPITATAIIK